MNTTTDSSARLDLLFLACFAAQLIIVLPIILADTLYIDDFGRAAEGWRHYSTAGRPLADALFFVLNLGDPAVNVFPLNQILAAAFISAGCVALASLFRLDRPPLVALATLPLGGQPYYLQNYSYAFDSVTMAAGLACAITAGFLTLQRRGVRSVFASTLLIMCSMFLYQYTVSAYALILIVVLAVRRPSLPQATSILLKSISATVSAVLVYYVFVEMPAGGYGERHATLLSFAELREGIVNNLANYWSMLLGHWSGSVFGFCALALALLVAIVIFRSSVGGNSRPKAFLLSTFVLITVGIVALLSLGIIALVKHPVFHPRHLIGLGVVLTLFNLVILSNTESAANSGLGSSSWKWLCRAPILLLAYTLVVFSFSYGRAIAAQRDFEVSLLTRLLHDVDTAGILPHVNASLILGIEPASPTLENTSRKFPAMLQLVPRYLDNDFTYGHKLLEHYGFPLKRLPITEARELCVLVYSEGAQLVLDRALYDLLIHEDVLIVKFRLPPDVKQQCDGGYSGVG
jgi:hypothetical protein